MIIFPRFRHKETGHLYDVVDSCTNCTNDGQIMIIYRSVAGCNKYCREEEEFLKKFEAVTKIPLETRE